MQEFSFDDDEDGPHLNVSYVQQPRQLATPATLKPRKSLRQQASLQMEDQQRIEDLRKKKGNTSKTIVTKTVSTDSDEECSTRTTTTTTKITHHRVQKRKNAMNVSFPIVV